jgi:hypothetical protein
MIKFEWDDAKALSNQRKHGISFEIARCVFEDPDAFSEQVRVEGGERRWQTLGRVGGVLMLIVAHTVRSSGEVETIRIISARRADRRETRRYEEERKKHYH